MARVFLQGTPYLCGSDLLADQQTVPAGGETPHLKLSGDVHTDPLPATGTETPAPALALTMTGGENRPTSLLMVYLADL